MPQPLRLCLELPQLLAGRGVGFAHWKSNHHLDAALAGETDLDVLVAPADAQAFAGVMAEAPAGARAACAGAPPCRRRSAAYAR